MHARHWVCTPKRKTERKKERKEGRKKTGEKTKKNPPLGPFGIRVSIAKGYHPDRNDQPPPPIHISLSLSLSPPLSRCVDAKLEEVDPCFALGARNTPPLPLIPLLASRARWLNRLDTLCLILSSVFQPSSASTRVKKLSPRRPSSWRRVRVRRNVWRKGRWWAVKRMSRYGMGCGGGWVSFRGGNFWNFAVEVLETKFFPSKFDRWGLSSITFEEVERKVSFEEKKVETVRFENTDFCYMGKKMGFGKWRRGEKFLLFSRSNHIWVKEKICNLQCMVECNYCRIGRKIRRKREVGEGRGFKLMLWVFIGDRRWKIWKRNRNVVKEDFKMGENGEGGERGGGLILGWFGIYTFLRLPRVFGNKIRRVEKES